MEEDKVYQCKLCNYTTIRIRDFKRHLKSSKHLKLFDEIKMEKSFECECGKKYRYYSGLSRHRPICPVYLSFMLDNVKNPNSIQTSNDVDEDIEQLLVSSNENVPKEETTTTAVTANTTINTIEDSSKKTETGELRELLTDIASQIKELKELKETLPVTTNYNNNYVLNLNMFLNENCKNAISLQDFVKQISFVFDDLKDRSWRSKVLLNNLGSMQLENRPFHCVDSTTQQVVLKNGSEWQEGSTDDIVSTLDSCGKHVQKQFGPQWELQHPGWTESDKYSRKYMDLWYHITREPTQSQVDEDVKRISNETSLKPPASTKLVLNK